MKESPVNTSATTGTTPGVLLKSARQEKGLSIDDVAARLCLSVHFVEDIERDDYSQMSARAYARGYVLSYAHLLRIPESQMLPALANVRMEFGPPKEALLIDDERVVPVYQSVDTSHQRSSFMLWGSILVLIILIGLAVMWWRGSAMTDMNTGDNKTVSTAVSIQPEGSTNSAATPATPGPGPTPPSSSTTPGSTPSSVPVPIPAPAASPTSSNAAPMASAPVSGPTTQLITPTPVAPSSAASDQNVMQPTELNSVNNASASARKASTVKLPPPRSSTDH